MPTAPRSWSFIIPIVLFTLACAGAVHGVHWASGKAMGQATWGVISYFMLLTLLLHAWQEPALEEDPKGFVRRYLAGLSIKMLLSFMVLVLLLLLLPKQDLLPLALSFILLYLAYLAFSTGRMAMLMRKYSRK
jgi:hypothetical protein